MKSPQEIAELVAARLRTAYNLGTGPVYRDPVEEIAAAVSAERARADGLREALEELVKSHDDGLLDCYAEERLRLVAVARKALAEAGK